MLAKEKKIKLIISGGGTGGHIFPAIAIAQAIQKLHPFSEFLFIGAKGKMEMEKIPAAGFAIEGLWISGLQRNQVLKNLLFPLKLISSLWNARRIIKKFNPDVVVGVGGYASGPTLFMANQLNIPTLIQEQNSYPGITNKMVSKKVNTICVAYPDMEIHFPKSKLIETGNPIRKHIIQTEGKREKAFKHFGLVAHKKTVLLIGGSLGAQSINHAIIAHIKEWQSSEFQLIWQTGISGIADAELLISNNNTANISVHQFIIEMDLAYAAADLVISRAGAIAISELCAVAKACILIPLPSAAEDHQTKNAKRLAEKKAAVLLPNQDAAEKLFDICSNLLKDEKKLEELRINIKRFAKTDADIEIAKEVLKLIAN
ncbi:MAG: undecaprenyldiphospho-muramoylpentapeptide beta-N-acetylglucosaminyltransferase [Bacteroidota bacterium]|jgi:UDP-N-acetylglucosamine--N-acetylmuramyl-(pentapeptide) pyrophosphoryl-undecaprenol N-acetylglucosamine transferase